MKKALLALGACGTTPCRSGSRPPHRVRIVGSYLSPYVRKALVVRCRRGSCTSSTRSCRSSATTPSARSRWARFRIDAARWPRAAAWVERTLDLPEFAALRAFEDLSIRTPIPKLRAALAEAGAPLTADTYFTDTPRRGIMRI